MEVGVLLLAGTVMIYWITTYQDLHKMRARIHELEAKLDGKLSRRGDLPSFHEMPDYAARIDFLAEKTNHYEDRLEAVQDKVVEAVERSGECLQAVSKLEHDVSVIRNARIVIQRPHTGDTVSVTVEATSDNHRESYPVAREKLRPGEGFAVETRLDAP